MREREVKERDAQLRAKERLARDREAWREERDAARVETSDFDLSLSLHMAMREYVTSQNLN